MRAWALVLDGVPFRSQSSDLVFVRADGRPAVLKVPFDPDERFGGILLRWWDGDGAARLFHLDEATGAMAIERACGSRDLKAMSEGGRNDEAVRILCDATARLHATHGDDGPAGLTPLRDWFEALPAAASRLGGLFASGSDVSQRLLADQRHNVPLHGDIHHGNVLDFGARGWLAIDPKRLVGERTFDYVNILRNRDPERMPDRERLFHTASLVAGFAQLDRRRLLEWTYTFSMLSAAWSIEDGLEPASDLAVARLVGAAIGIEPAAPAG